MSEGATGATGAEPPVSAPDGWGQPITEARQAELDALAEQQRAWAEQPEAERGASPCREVSLSGADVCWLAARAIVMASAENDTATVTALLRDRTQALALNLPTLHLERAFLTGAHLEGAQLDGAHLEGVHLLNAHLEGARLMRAHLEGSLLGGAHLEHAQLDLAHLEGANLEATHLEGARLIGTHLEGAHLMRAQLEGAQLEGAQLEGADVSEAHLEGANLTRANLEGARLQGAHLEGANLTRANLACKAYAEGNPVLQRIRRSRSWLLDFSTMIPAADLRGAFLDAATELSRTSLIARDPALADATGPRFADVHWGAVNLIVVDWEPIARLWDEREAEHALYEFGDRKDRQTRTDEYRAAGRAYRLLSVALRAQGLSADATRYHYRAEVMDRRALFHRRAFGRWLFSWLLGTFAGYGDRLGRLFATYGVTVLGFALAMLVAAVQVKANQPISLGTLRDVLVLSVTSFHGRGIQPPGLHLDDVLAMLAGAEAVFGLLIEGLFIAAFTRRVTGG